MKSYQFKSRYIILFLMGYFSCCHAENLVDAYHTALFSSPAFHAQVAKHEAKKIAVKKAWSALLPKAKATGYVERAGINSSYQNPTVFNSLNDNPQFKKSTNLYQYGVEVTQPLFNMKDFISLSSSNKVALASDIADTLAKQELMLQVAAHYFQVLSAQDELIAIQAEKNTLTKQLGMVNHLVQHGVDTRISLSEVTTAFNMVLAAEMEAKNKLQKSQNEMTLITGQKIDNIIALTKKVTPHSPVPNSLDAWQNAALKGNLLIQLNQLNTQLAHMNMQLAESHFYPELNAVAGITRNQGFLPGLGVYNQTQEAAGLELSIPLSNGGYDVANVHQAEKNLESKYYQLDAIRLMVKERTNSTFDTIQLLIQKIYADQLALKSAHQMQAYSLRAYQLGTRTVSDVLNANHQVFQAENNWRDDIYRYFLATLELKALTGSLDEKDLQDVNQFF